NIENGGNEAAHQSRHRYRGSFGNLDPPEDGYEKDDEPYGNGRSRRRRRAGVGVGVEEDMDIALSRRASSQSMGGMARPFSLSGYEKGLGRKHSGLVMDSRESVDDGSIAKK
ncbi:hypothetical protein FS842_002085, partial [Serendipita sp. 407]